MKQIKRKTGKFVKTSLKGEGFQSFVPAKLPVKPALDLTELQPLLDKANFTLGKLSNVTENIPNIDLILYFYVRKEALLSSQIEGTQSSFDDLLLYESKEVPKVPVEDVEEVSNYVSAIKYGLQRMEKLPLSSRLIKEIHKILLQGSRGSNKQPGEFRTSQNWIGGTRPGNAIFVPPPYEEALECMSNLEKFLHDEYGKTPTLIKAAIAHLQFETIHPFLDGNGRVGRLLITLLLCSEEVLTKPILYLSLYLKQNRKTYYELLSSVREVGNWEAWIEFFLTAVIETANETIDSVSRILDIFEKDIEKIQTLGRAKESATKVFEYLQAKAICNIPDTSKDLGISQPTVTASIEHLMKLGIVSEATGKKRERIYSYEAYLNILSEGC
ncbi:MAG: cell filamentation protein Fic [Alphaproteobacteria bacterium CG11_big_fil_rev_8_21_14_0_20_44_7]|nr:MAG: cell filamentation protein Fic [Alphaproteobacteria bacterium CG11_big_fil_rev_8_21_14_0_20_44_7]